MHLVRYRYFLDFFTSLRTVKYDAQSPVRRESILIWVSILCFHHVRKLTLFHLTNYMSNSFLSFIELMSQPLSLILCHTFLLYVNKFLICFKGLTPCIEKNNGKSFFKGGKFPRIGRYIQKLKGMLDRSQRKDLICRLNLGCLLIYGNQQISITLVHYPMTLQLNNIVLIAVILFIFRVLRLRLRFSNSLIKHLLDLLKLVKLRMTPAWGHLHLNLRLYVRFKLLSNAC